MKNSVAQFVALRAKLESERAALTQRLQEIDAALGTASPRAAAPSLRTAGTLTMRDAIALAVKNTPRKVSEIAQTLPTLGFRFTSKNPVNSVGAYLYGPGKQHFKSTDGRFSAR